jgi:fibronectin type 3 domain-containing protein
MPRNKAIILLAVTLFSLAGLMDQARAQKNVVAIFNLRPTNIEAMDYSGDILYTLVSALSQEDSIEVMSRREMEESLFRGGLAQGDNPKQVIKAGNALGVNYVLFGNVTAKGGQVRAELKLMNVPNKRVIDTWLPMFSGREAIQSEIASLVKAIENVIAKSKPFVTPEPADPKTQEVRIGIQNFRARNQDGKLVLRWKFDTSQPIFGFNIYRSSKKAGPFQFVGKTNKNRFTDSGLKRDQLYYYHLGILRGSGQEVKSKQSTQIIYTAEKMPYPPPIMRAKGHVRRATIEFVPSLQNDKENFKITQYKLYRQSDDGSEWAPILSIAAKKGYQSNISLIAEDRKIPTDDQTCTYALSSIDNRGRESPFSDPITIRTIKRPTFSLGKDNLLREIHFTWAPVKTIKGYNLYRRYEQKEWKKIGRISGASKISFTDKTNLDDGKHYQYYLTVYDEKSETGPSNTVAAKTKDLPPCPKEVGAHGGLVKSVKLSWTPVGDPDIGGYTIYRGLDVNNFNRITQVKGHRSNSYLDKGKTFTSLKDGKTYYYKIVSYNLFKAEGESSPVIQATTKPRPTSTKGFAVAAGSDRITVRWDPNPESDIENYTLYRNRNGGMWSKLKELDSGHNDYHDKDLKVDAVYRYRIIVQDKDGLKSDPLESESVKSPIVKTN